MQPISQTPYDLNNELLFRYSGHGLNNEPFGNRTTLDHSNTKLIRYSDPHCKCFSTITCKLVKYYWTEP